MNTTLEKHFPTLAKLGGKKNRADKPADPVNSADSSSEKTTKLKVPEFKRPSFSMPKGPSLSLSKQKTGGTVGLEIESGSIAATEVSGNGVVGGTAITQLPPGVVAE